MNRTGKFAAAAFVVGLLCLPVIYLIASQYWTKRTAVVFPQPPEEEVLWTGIIPTTNGWEFKLENVLDFGRRGACHIEFCTKTRQLFIAFRDKDDDGLYQWDVDKRQCVHTFRVGKGFHPYDYAVSPDGKYLIVERLDALVKNWETLIFEVEKKTVVRELGDIGCWYRDVRFSADGGIVWVDARSLENWDRGVAFRFDGTLIKDSPKEDFPKLTKPRIWDVGVSKDSRVKPGLFYEDPSGNTNLLTLDWWQDNYWITKDGNIIVASNWRDELVIWDAGSTKELARQRITNHHNGGGYLIYDEAKDRFLIADPSYQGTTFLRELLITKRPSRTSQVADKF